MIGMEDGERPALDLPFILAIVFLLSLIVVAGNLIADFLYAIVDPRTTRGRDTVRVKAAVGGVI